MKITCQKCGFSHEEGVLSCDCGFDLQKQAAVQREKAGHTAGNYNTESKLIFVSRFLFVLGILRTLLAIIEIVGNIVNYHSFTEIILNLLPVIVTLIIIFGLSYAIKKIVDNERGIIFNTRKVIELERKIKELQGRKK